MPVEIACHNRSEHIFPFSKISWINWSWNQIGEICTNQPHSTVLAINCLKQVENGPDMANDSSFRESSLNQTPLVSPRMTELNLDIHRHPRYPKKLYILKHQDAWFMLQPVLAGGETNHVMTNMLCGCFVYLSSYIMRLVTYWDASLTISHTLGSVDTSAVDCKSCGDSVPREWHLWFKIPCGGAVDPTHLKVHTCMHTSHAQCIHKPDHYAVHTFFLKPSARRQNCVLLCTHAYVLSNVSSA